MRRLPASPVSLVGPWVRPRFAWTLALLALAGCHDFEEGRRLCLERGVCWVADAGPAYAVLIDPPAVTIRPGGIAAIAVGFKRGDVRDDLVFAFDGDGADGGLFARFAKNSGHFTQTTMTVHVPLPFPAATYRVTLRSLLDGGEVARAPLDVTVPRPAATLLVDDDDSANNAGNDLGTPSPNDAFFAGAPPSADLDTWVNPLGWDGGTGPLTPEALESYSTVVWYTGPSLGGANLTASDERALARWLDRGGRRLLLISQNYILDAAASWTATRTSFLPDYLGALGGANLPSNVYALSGVAGQATQGLALTVAKNTPTGTALGLVNLGPGTAPLLTVSQTADGGELACATLRKNVGDAGTSTFVFAGLPLVNVVDAGPGSSRQAAWDALQAAAKTQ